MFITDTLKSYNSKAIKKILNLPDASRRFLQTYTSRIYPNPIIILGHAKSGTTAIAKLLGEVSGKSVTIDPIFRIDPEGVLNHQLFNRELALSTLVQSYKFYFSTPLWKDPKLTFFYDELRQFFPSATYIFVIRDPRDTIRSFLNRRGIPGDLDNLPSPLEEKAGGIARLPIVAGNNYIERLANRWNCATDVYLNHPDDFCLVRYEDFCLDKPGTIASLAKKVGLHPTNDLAGHLNKQYQPKGNHAVSWSKFYKSSHLHSIETICKERMDHFNYQVSK
ncbi:sulfotransferase [Acaryochloris sp. IP29b_bin.148]|uniref:sulfotransferase family protein n=1 Tax=Acaryochloris sp. IP29b_bin.148 TaxID=2969218 RepID=UPI00262D6916|nr:sulfotransferase [Acaryochloris sp. IP29b_bin.148]